MSVKPAGEVVRERAGRASPLRCESSWILSEFWLTCGCEEKANVAFPPQLARTLGCYLKGKLRSVKLGVSDAANELSHELRNIS